MGSVDNNRSQDDIRVGRVLDGRYRLLRLIGHGGMGSVYEAVHVHTEKRVAIKLLSSSLSKDLKLVTRFQREAKAAGKIKHENCVGVDEFGEDADGTFFIAMELVDGHGLADELRKVGPLPWERVARIAVQLLKALDAAHAAGVLHRDLKPQNVMLTQKPSRPDIVKVVDFGIAKITTHSAEDQAALTVPGTIFGTPEYMSPEQARGEVLDAASDLYSASVVLWHILLGRSPFRGASVRETLMKVFAEEPPSPRAERPGANIPEGFEAALRKGLAKKKEERYRDAGEYLEALRPFVDRDIDLPRRPAPGLARDGAPPPSTIDDNPNRSVTLALGEGGVSDTRFGALPTLALPSADGPSGAAPDEDIRPPGRISTAAIVVLAGAVVGLAGIGVGAYTALEGGAAGPVTVVDAGVLSAAAPDAGVVLAPPPGPPRPDPDARDAALVRGDRALAQGDLAGAARGFDDAITADPASAKAHASRATVALQLHDWVQARDHIARARELDAGYRDKLAALHKTAETMAAKTAPARDAGP